MRGRGEEGSQRSLEKLGCKIFLENSEQGNLEKVRSKQMRKRGCGQRYDCIIVIIIR